MMITIKSQREIERMREAGKITAAARSVGRQMLRDGVTTEEINKEIHKFILSCGATPTFLGYGGFPKSACISVNDEVIHGIPGKRLIRNGDIVSIDVGATYKGYVGDCAGTFPVGEVSPEAQELIRITRQSFFEGLRHARAGGRLYDISAAVQQYAESHSCGVVRDYVGHGIGAKMHEDPEVPNYGRPGHGIRLMPGMTFCIEPMINQKGDGVRVLKDGWTVVTANGSLSAHFEHQIAITKDGPVIMTRV